MTSSRSSIGMLRPSGASSQLGDQMRHELELRVLVERLVEHQLEDRLRVRREALVGIPGWHIARPADRHRVIGRAHDRGCRKRRRGHAEKAAASCCERHETPLVIAAKLAVAAEADNTARPSPSSRAVTLTRIPAAAAFRQKTHRGRTRIEADQPDAHRQHRAERRFVAVVQHSARQHLAGASSVTRHSSVSARQRRRVRAADTAPSRMPCSAAAPVCHAGAAFRHLRASVFMPPAPRPRCKCRDRS